MTERLAAHCEHTPCWLVCGSGPSARLGMLTALEDQHPQITCTTNGGHRLFDSRTGRNSPTFYFLNDVVACEMYAVDAGYLQHHFGTLVVAVERAGNANACRGLHPDQTIQVDNGLDTCEHHPGRYPPHPQSGLYCIDIALNRGARTVCLSGFDGYMSAPGSIVVDYFDGREGVAKSKTLNARQEKYLRSAVERRPDVRFIMYGEPCYAVPTDLPNFRVCPVGVLA